MSCSFFAASDYSQQAVKYADEVGMCLFTYAPVGARTAVNAAATRLAKLQMTKDVSIDRMTLIANWFARDGWRLGILATGLVLVAVLFGLLSLSSR